MPYLKVKTNITVGDDRTPRLLTRFSQMLAGETGKSERYVMVEIETDRTMLFSGNDQPLAYVECKSIGLNSEQAKLLSAAICRILDEDLQIQAERVYIEFSDCPREFWGWNGATFA